MRFKKLLLILLSWFGAIALYADTLPPLPLKSLLDIKIPITETNPSFLKDTVQIILAVEPFLRYSNLNLKLLKFSRPFLLTGLLFNTQRDYDFSNYEVIGGELILGNATKNHYREFAIGIKRKYRGFLCDDLLTLKPSYSQYRFISKGVIEHRLLINLYRMQKFNVEYLTKGTANFKIYLNTALGNITGSGKFYFRNLGFRKTNNRFDSYFTFGNLIFLGEQFFIRPQGSYYFPISNHNRLLKFNECLGTTVDVGFLINRWALTLRGSLNLFEEMPLDSVLETLAPYNISYSGIDLLTRKQLAEILLSYNDFILRSGYEIYLSYWQYNFLNDCLELVARDTIYNRFYFGADLKPFRQLRTTATIFYTLQNFYLFPKFSAQESVIFAFKPLETVISLTLINKRSLPEGTGFPKYVILSSALRFHYRKLSWAFEAENILDSKSEAYPGFPDKGRKYWLRICFQI
jgi:hypothetical protein